MGKQKKDEHLLSTAKAVAQIVRGSSLPPAQHESVLKIAGYLLMGDLLGGEPDVPEMS